MKNISFCNSLLFYRDTHWDKKILGLDTKEILSIIYNNKSELHNIIDKFENTIFSKTFVYFRCDSNDQAIKQEMIKRKYYIAESALIMHHTKLHRIDFSKLYRSNLELDTNIDRTEIKKIQLMSYNTFNYSRFHEDPFIECEKARRRYYNWIPELIAQKNNLLVYRQDNEIISFMFFSIEKETAKLILGGTKEGYGMMAPYFWSSVLMYLQKSNIKKVEAIISSANLVVLNLYINLGFNVKKTFFDYHKLYF
ncbi:MAG: hypothetical protein D3914_02170 [Candidatus Electrothrix sp. LOE2]|nr:hypothetical protein [Candidatus Electrothrix sp. LOE2]